MWEIPKSIKGRRRKDVEKIINFARLAGVHGVSFVQCLTTIKLEPNAFYDRERRTLIMYEGFDSETLISVLLHELGHHIEMNQRQILVDETTQIIMDNSLLFPNLPEKELEKWEFQTEFLAWHLGEEVAKLLGIKLPKNHKKSKLQGLDTYLPKAMRPKKKK